MVSGASGLVGVSVGEADEILGPWTFAITAIGACSSQAIKNENE
jgi:hypothetical protein